MNIASLLYLMVPCFISIYRLTFLSHFDLTMTFSKIMLKCGRFLLFSFIRKMNLRGVLMLIFIAKRLNKSLFINLTHTLHVKISKDVTCMTKILGQLS